MVTELQITMIIAIITGGGIIATLIINIREHRLTTAAHFTSILNDLAKEHSELLLYENKLKTYPQCITFVFAYCDLLDRIAYLCINKKIQPEVAEKFTEYFEYVQLVMKWHDKIIKGESPNLRSASKRWKHTHKWCSEQKIPPDTDLNYLPNSMKKICEERNITDLKF